MRHFWEYELVYCPCPLKQPNLKSMDLGGICGLYHTQGSVDTPALEKNAFKHDVFDLCLHLRLTPRYAYGKNWTSRNVTSPRRRRKPGTWQEAQRAVCSATEASRAHCANDNVGRMDAPCDCNLISLDICKSFFHCIHSKYQDHVSIPKILVHLQLRRFAPSEHGPSSPASHTPTMASRTSTILSVHHFESCQNPNHRNHSQRRDNILTHQNMLTKYLGRICARLTIIPGRTSGIQELKVVE